MAMALALAQAQAQAHSLQPSVGASLHTKTSHSRFNGAGLASHLALKFNAHPTALFVEDNGHVERQRYQTRIRGKRRSLQCYASYGPSSTSGALTPELKANLDKFITSNKVVLFMKGTKDFPQCGFSNTVVQILKTLNVPFETFNILENETLRQGLKQYSNWPTFPQLYIDGEFFGGCDITIEAYKSGELQELLEKAMCS